MEEQNPGIIPAKSSKRSAKIFNYGTIAALLVPFPIFILWFGASMFVYAMFRHHPNPRVGYYTQLSAYYYYGMAGALVPVLTFAPKEFFIQYWWALWIVCAVLIIPLAIRDIIRVNKEEWHDVEIPKDN
jgi:hypothetical protein